ncbi:MAG TPA: peptidylprolyl isomerase [Phycisphaerales bacterium]|nr:peptidylprolyl isomerase [Phycisphaerales bacterium]
MLPLMPPAAPRCTSVVALLALLACAGPVLAQLSPNKLYFGVNRAIPMTVTVPAPAAIPNPVEGEPAATPPAVSQGEIRIDLFDPKKLMADAEATAPVLAGPVDLATLFPILWQGPTPKLRYAQLVVNGVQIGPPVVLQPMTSPASAVLLNPQTREVYFNDPENDAPNFKPEQGALLWITEPPAYSGIRAYVDKHVRVQTSQGDIEFRLLPQHAPNTAFNFRHLAEGGFYDNTIVHRVVNKLPGTGQPFVIQFGDPTGTGAGGPGYAIDLEPSTLAHDFGVLSMARESELNTNGSQVFIALSREGTAPLDGKYTAFAEAVSGAETILAISRVPVQNQRPNTPPTIISASLVDAPPYGQRGPRVQRPTAAPGAR